MHDAAPAGATGSPISAKPKRRSAALGVVLILVALLVCALALGAFVFYRKAISTEPELAKFAPAQTAVYLEVPNLRQLAVRLVELTSLEQATAFKLQHEQAFTRDLAAGLQIDEALANELQSALTACATALVDTKQEPLVLFRFSSADPVEKLLVGKSKLPNVTNAGGNALYRQGSSLFLWLPAEKVLVFGKQPQIDAVIAALDTGGLAKSERWRNSHWPSDSSAILWFDPSAVAAIDATTRGDYLDGVAPWTLSVQLLQAGVKFTTDLQFKGRKLPATQLQSSSQQLDLYKRLPAETLAYVAYSTQHDTTGKDVELELRRQTALLGGDARSQAEQALALLDSQLGVTLAELLDALGDQGIVGITVDETAKGKPFDLAQLTTQYGLVAIQQLKDVAHAKRILKTLGEKASQMALGAGYSLVVSDTKLVARNNTKDAPSLQLWIEDDRAIVAIGQGPVLQRIAEASTANRTLADVAAHKLALEALPAKSQLSLWVDFGSMLTLADAVLGSTMQGVMPMGDSRPTFALTGSYEVKDGAWNVHVETLNTQWAALLARDSTPGQPRSDLSSLLKLWRFSQ